MQLSMKRRFQNEEKSKIPGRIQTTVYRRVKVPCAQNKVKHN